MSELVEFEGEFYQGANVRDLGRIVSLSGSRPPLVQADVSEIALAIFDLTGDTPTTNLYTGLDPVVATVIFDALVTGNEWPDDIGYNFDHTVDAADFLAKGEHSYRFEYLFTTVTDGVIPAVWLWKCRRIRS